LNRSIPKKISGGFSFDENPLVKGQADPVGV
jgi:hypothetical protein